MTGPPLNGASGELPGGISRTLQLDVTIAAPGFRDLYPAAESLRAKGFRVEEGLPATLFVQKVGSSGDQLADELKSEGFVVEFKQAHTWRNGVCIRQEESS